MGRIMWSQIEGLYRGQALNGTVLTIDDEALRTALEYAGDPVYDTEWWMETLNVVLERWGLRSKHWTDPTTQVLRIHFRVAEPDPQGANGDSKVGTGPLTARLNSGKLGTGGLNSGNLNTGRLNPNRVGERR